MYALGSLYQAASISINEALKMGQEVADRVSFDLGLEEPFTALQFLRDELESELESESESESEDDETEDESPDPSQ
jgi:hypothetical protein